MFCGHGVGVGAVGEAGSAIIGQIAEARWSSCHRDMFPVFPRSGKRGKLGWLNKCRRNRPSFQNSPKGNSTLSGTTMGVIPQWSIRSLSRYSCMYVCNSNGDDEYVRYRCRRYRRYRRRLSLLKAGFLMTRLCRHDGIVEFPQKGFLFLPS